MRQLLLDRDNDNSAVCLTVCHHLNSCDGKRMRQVLRETGRRDDNAAVCITTSFTPYCAQQSGGARRVLSEMERETLMPPSVSQSLSPCNHVKQKRQCETRVASVILCCVRQQGDVRQVLRGTGREDNNAAVSQSLSLSIIPQTR